VKMLTEDMLQPLLQQMFKIASYSMDTIPEMSSPFISHLIDNCLLYARPDRTQMLLQLVFQKLQKSFKLVFCCKFFHGSVSPKSSNSYRFKKYNVILFAQIISVISIV